MLERRFYHKSQSSILSSNQPWKGKWETANGKPQGAPDMTGRPYRYAVPFDLFARGYRLPRKNWVSVTRPFCDRMVLTGRLKQNAVIAEAIQQNTDPADYLKKLVGQAQLTLGKKLEGHDPVFTFVQKSKVAGYKTGSTDLPPRAANTDFGLSTVAIKKGEYAGDFRLRIDLNPHRLGPAGLKAVEEVFTVLFLETLNFDEWLAGAMTTRLDIAMDIFNAALPDMVFRHPDAEKWSGFFSRSGQLETWSGLKKKKGKHHPIVVAYDKRRERIDSGKEPRLGDIPHVRIERRIPATSRKFTSLPELANPFMDLEVGYLPTATARPSKSFQSYCLAAQRVGLEAADALAPASKKDAWRASFLQCRAEFWGPTDVWEYWKDTMRWDGLGEWVERARRAAEKPSFHVTAA